MVQMRESASRCLAELTHHVYQTRSQPTMISRILTLCAVFLTLASLARADETALFTVAEKQWIAQHPVVRVGIDVDKNAPIEYIEDGRYQGLAAEFMDFVARTSGLKLQLVPQTTREVFHNGLEQEKVDIYPIIASAFKGALVGDAVLYTTPYYLGWTAVITRPSAPVMRSWESLSGKTVALRYHGFYAIFVRENFPDIRILEVDSVDDALAAVADGRADATLGLDVMMFQYLRGAFAGKLSFAGRIETHPLNLGMGIRKDMPILASIVEKSLAAMTARQNEQYILHWEESFGHRRPSLASLLYEYALQIGMFVLGAILLAVFYVRERRARRQAIRSEHEKSMFLAVMSHEIRSPMNAIVSAVELLQRRELDQMSQKLVAVAGTASETLLGLLNNVLDFSKLEAKRIDLLPRPCDIWALTRATVDMVRLRAQAKGLSLTLQVDGNENPWIVVDETRLRQILSNLLSNAVKFTEQGGVAVHARLDMAAQDSDGGELVLSVSDTGVGISPEAQKKLFQPFFQADASVAARYGGTGLGLMICRDLVTLMGGRMALRSEAGKGTTVELAIPCRVITGQPGAQAAESLPEISAQEAPHDAAPASKILVVEDQAANRFTIERQLTALGCTVVMADSGPSALRILQQEPVDLVLMDCYMPGMDGYATAKAMRESMQENIQDNAREGAKRIPIIAISAATDAAHQEKCFNSGMDGILAKPLRLKELKQLLNIWLDRSVLAPAVEEALSNQALHALFMQSVRGDATQMRAACSARNVELLLHLSHRIKGAAPMYGAEEAAELADSLESALKLRQDIDWRTIADAVEALNEVVDGIEKTLESQV